MAIAPTLAGLLTLGLFILGGGLTWINHQEPYYLPQLSVLHWILYSHLSPADIRTFIKPYHR
jgi:hypothetical protein